MGSSIESTQEDIIQSWHKRAHAYNQLIKRWPIFTDMASRLIEYIPNNFGGHALDIAGGSGLLSKCLLEKHPAARVTLVEPAENMRALALQQLGSRIDIVNATSDSLDALNITVDAALCSASFHLMDEAIVLPSVASVLNTGAVFAINCWGHSFDEAVELNQRADWMQYVDLALSEFNQPSLDRSKKTVPTIKSTENLRIIGGSCGLELIEKKIVTDDIYSQFNIEFAAMSDNFLSHIDNDIRKKVIDQSLELCRSIDTISVVDLCFEKVS